MTRHRHIIALVLGAAAIAACGDSAQMNITAPASGARVMFLNESLGAPGVNFFADTTKLTAVYSSNGTVSTAGTPFGTAANGGLYTQVTPGQHTLAAHLSDTTGATISSVSATTDDGKWYSYFQVGKYDATNKAADAFVVEDPIPSTWDYTVANVRFVNAIYNANPGTLTVTNADTSVHTGPLPVGAATAYKVVGAYVAVPAGSYNLSVTGLRTAAVTKTNVTLGGGRYYTIVARGDATLTTGGNAPTLDAIANR